MIQEGDIYQSADPRDDGRQVRVTEWVRFNQKAKVVSHPSGDRPRYVQASSLNDSVMTKKGERRRTGYFRVEPLAARITD